MESHTLRRIAGALAAVALVSCAAIASAASGRVEQSGLFALVGGTPKIESKFWVSHPSDLSGTLKVRQFTLDGKPILDYDVDMEHIMHMIIVRDDFATFAHVHPDFDTTTGTFWQAFTKEANHRYYVYADSTPRGIGQQVFRFTLDNSGPIARSAPVGGPSERNAIAGSYTVTLSRTTLAANRAKNLDVTIVEGGEPAQDLAAYLGAAAHAVFINTVTLAYVHLHPMVRGQQMKVKAGKTGAMNMSMGGGKSGPFMQMAVPALPAGTYKLWIQFLGNGTVYTVPFTLLAQ